MQIMSDHYLASKNLTLSRDHEGDKRIQLMFRKQTTSQTERSDANNEAQTKIVSIYLDATVAIKSSEPREYCFTRLVINQLAGKQEQDLHSGSKGESKCKMRMGPASLRSVLVLNNKRKLSQSSVTDPLLSHTQTLTKIGIQTFLHSILICPL